MGDVIETTLSKANRRRARLVTAYGQSLTIDGFLLRKAP